MLKQRVTTLLKPFSAIRIFLTLFICVLLPNLGLANNSTDYRIHIGVFSQQSHAQQLAKRLKALLHTDIQITLKEQAGKTLYYVDTSIIHNGKNVKRYEQLLENAKISSWVSQRDSEDDDIVNAMSSVINDKQAKEPNQPLIIANGNTHRVHPASVRLEQKKAVSAKHPTKTNTEVKPGHLWNLRNADVRSVIAAVSKITGKNFIIDSRVHGNISIISSHPLAKDEVYQVFLSMLQISGYTAIPTDNNNVLKIIPNMSARQSATRLANFMQPGKGDEYIVRVIPIRYVSAERLLSVLRPLMPQWASVSVYEPTNSVILSGRADNINRLFDIIEKIDSKEENQVDIVTLKHANANNIVHTIQGLQTSRADLQSKVKIAADERANVILISGPRTARLQMRILISQLDRRSPKGSGNTQVIYLQYMHARDIVPILAGVAQSNYHGPVGTIIGTRADQQKLDIKAQDGAQGNSDIDQSYNPAPGDVSGNTAMIRTGGTATGTSKSNAPPPVEIIGEPNTNAVIINAPARLMKILKAVIAKVDIRPAQVLVEALIAEISEDDIKKLGVQWGTVSSENLQDNKAVSLNNFEQGIGIINRNVVKNNFSNYQAVVRALANENKADILSTPSIVVLDNHQAKILVGQQVSVKSSEYPNNASGTSGATPFTTFDRLDVALKLYVTPQINQGDTVQLLIHHENDTLLDPQNITDTPPINKTTINTTVLVHSGDVLVLGGLIQNQLNINQNRIPLLGKLPLLGAFFRDKTSTLSKKNLMVFLRPVILKTPQKNVEVTNDKYHYMRDAQVSYLQRFDYTHGLNKMLLPHLTPVPVLPPPFPEAQLAHRHEPRHH